MFWLVHVTFNGGGGDIYYHWVPWFKLDLILFWMLCSPVNFIQSRSNSDMQKCLRTICGNQSLLRPQNKTTHGKWHLQNNFCQSKLLLSLLLSLLSLLLYHIIFYYIILYYIILYYIILYHIILYYIISYYIIIISSIIIIIISSSSIIIITNHHHHC